MSGQFADAVLGILRTSDGELSGRTIREHLAKPPRIASFYSKMADLETEGIVQGFYRTVEIGEKRIPQRWYRLPDLEDDEELCP